MEALIKKSSLQAVFFVLGSVILGLISAWCLKEASQQKDISISSLVLVMCIVVGVNVGRFLLWGYIHKHYPLSLSYPINSLFFPFIFIMGYYYGESISLYQILGVVLITSGVAILAYEGKNDEAN